MSTVLLVAAILLAWFFLSLPLAVAVGRAFAAGHGPVPLGVTAGDPSGEADLIALPLPSANLPEVS